MISSQYLHNIYAIYLGAVRLDAEPHGLAGAEGGAGQAGGRAGEDVQSAARRRAEDRGPPALAHHRDGDTDHNDADMCAVFDNVIPQVPSISATPSTYSFPSRQAGPGPEPIYTTRPLLHPGQENDS